MLLVHKKEVNESFFLAKEYDISGSQHLIYNKNFFICCGWNMMSMCRVYVQHGQIAKYPKIEGCFELNRKPWNSKLV